LLATFKEFVSWTFVNVMVGLGLASLAAYPPFWRATGAGRGRFWRDVVAASLMAVFCMSVTWSPAPGMKMDIRMVPLGLAGWTYGLPAAVVVGAAIIAGRLFMAGSAATTIAWTIICVAIVPLFHGRRKTFRSIAALGVAQWFAGFVVGQTMVHPQPPGLEPSSPIWLFLVAVQVLSLWCVDRLINNLSQNEQLQRNLARALRSKEAILRLINHAIIVLDAAGTVTDLNPAARALLPAGRLPPAISAHPQVAAALRDHEAITGCRVNVLDGGDGERFMLVSTIPLENGDMLLGIENVTTVVRAEREEARRHRLELLGRMAAMAAHEIKNPLTTIKGFLQLMARRPEFAAHRPTFSLVQGEVEHINRVVGDFLDLSRTGESPPVAVPVDPLLNEVVAGMELQFPDSGVTVELVGRPGLNLLGDPKSLKQILRNLVANAYEAMPGGGRLTLRRDETPQGIYIEVADSGPGIAPDVLMHIFTPYMTTKSTGTGLGLAISHKLAADLGAELTVVSGEQGSTFRLLVPPAVAAGQAAAGALPAEANE
jgi:signal transduction histidine kinase